MADTLISGTTIIEDKRSERGEILSIPGVAFHGLHPDIDDVGYNQNDEGSITNDGAAAISVCAPVNLPNGVTVTEVQVFGNAGAEDETWTLWREAHEDSGAGDAMASSTVNSEDTTVLYSVIDNYTYRYWINVVNIEQNDQIKGARIEYEF